MPNKLPNFTDWRARRLTLPQEPDYLVDVADINRKLALVKDSPFQWLEGEFAVPAEITPFQEATRQKWAKEAMAAGHAFVQAMASRAWTLKSKLTFTGSYPATDTEGRVREGYLAYRVKGVFATVPRPLRIEVPEALVKQDPEHRLDLKTAIKNQN